MEIIPLEYIAGLFDGEGWVSITRHKPYVKYGQKSIVYTARVGIESTDTELLEQLQAQVGGSLHKRKNKRAENRKITHVWYVDGSKAVPLMSNIYPFLRTKKKQVEVLFKYVGHATAYREKNKRRSTPMDKETLAFREECVQEIRKLNGFQASRLSLTSEVS